MSFPVCRKCGAEIRDGVMWVRRGGKLVPEHRDCGMYVTERSPEWALVRMSDFTETAISPEQNDRIARRRYLRFKRRQGHAGD